MTDPGFLTNIAAGLKEEKQGYNAFPPSAKFEVQGSWGAAFVVTGACLALKFGADPASYPEEVVIGWCAMMVIGALLFCRGWRGARGPRNSITALLAIAQPIGGGLALLHWMPDLLTDPLVQSLAAGLVAKSLTTFLFAVRGPGGDAQKIVNRQIYQNEIHWQGVKRRR
jgi:hypothetical protein